MLTAHDAGVVRLLRRSLAQDPSLMNLNLNGNWRIACDPENRGREQLWPASIPAAAQPAPVPGIIQQVFPGYHGVAWYWTPFVPPRLPAVDERVLLVQYRRTNAATSE